MSRLAWLVLVTALAGCALALIGWQRSLTWGDAFIGTLLGTLLGLIVGGVLYWRATRRED